ncbi:MAG: hypothetical protein KDA81_10875 [Planctomycetaceae bacterium]|nr:hypothetical protein [Planctomycetaceae bacterium]
MKLNLYQPAANFRNSESHQDERRAALKLPSTFLAIDWMGNSVTITEMSIRQDEISIGKRVHAVWPEDARPEINPVEAGHWLNSQVRSAGMQANSVLVSAPRGELVLNLLEVPTAVTDLTRLVQSQAEVRSRQPLENLVLDYIAQPAEPESNVRHVLLVVMLRSMYQQIVTLVESAGLSLIAVGSGDLSAPVLGTGTSEHLHLDILCNEARTELVLSRHRRPLASYSLSSLPADPDQAAQRIAAGTRRILEALPETLRSIEFSSASVLGARSSEILQPLKPLLQCRIQQSNDHRHHDVRLLALVHAVRQHAPYPDLTHPRKPIDHTAVRRRTLIRAAALTAVLASVLGGGLFLNQQEYSQRITALEKRHTELQEVIERGQTHRMAHVFLQDWQQGQPDWCRELHDFVHLMPPAGQVCLTRLELEHRSESPTATIRSTGLAATANDVIDFQSRLLENDDHYQLQPRGLQSNSGDGRFTVRFTTEVNLSNSAP